MAVSPTVRIDVSGARGKSEADLLRLTGAYGVLPTDSDLEAELKKNAVAIEASEDAQAARDVVADLVLPQNKVVGGSLAAAEALFAAGTKFAWVHDGLIEVRERTVGGSTFLLSQPTTAALASPAPDKGAALVGYGDRTVAQKLAYLAIDRREYATLQLAVTAAAASGRALYLGDEEFTQTTSVILPDADICIFGPGSGALTITFTGTGGLFVATGLSAATNIDIGGFTARAGSANCGRPVNIEYTASTGINVRAVRLFDIVADIPEDATSWWTGGPRIKNARNSVIQECYTRGAYDSLTKTLDGMQIAGEATDVKITNFQAISVGKGLDIIDQVEGTIITGFVAVDVNIGVSKVHIGTAEPWLSMTNWHISTRRTGIYMDNVLQATISPGLIYCQNGDGEFIGIHVDGGSIANQDMKISAIVDAQLGGAGMTDSTGIEIAQGNGIDVDLTTRAVSTCAYFGALAYDNIVRIMPSDYDVIVTGTGVNQFNRIVANIPGKGWALPKVVGPYNPDATSAAGKTAEVIGYGTDTVNTVKGVGGLRLVAQNENWTDCQPEIVARRGDVFVQAAVFMGNGSPEGVLPAPVGALYTRADGGAGTTLYIKESGTGNTGWVAK